MEERWPKAGRGGAWWFRGSKREIPFGRILTPPGGEGWGGLATAIPDRWKKKRSSGAESMTGAVT